MAQLTIYLDEATHRKVEAAAKRDAVSLSRWARENLARAADLSSGKAWDHLGTFVGTVGEDFEVPLRSSEEREIPSLE